jgi:hypothetical protein
MIHAFGDSFVVGDQDDFIGDQNTDPNNPPTHNMNEKDREKYLKYNVSFVSIIAQHLNTKLKNYAVRGTGNFPQLDKLWTNLIDGNIVRDDIVFFGITTGIRDRLGSLTNENRNSLSILHHGNWADLDGVLNADQYYILSILSQMSSMFNVRIIKFNLFDNPMGKLNDDLRKRLTFPDYIGDGKEGTTLVDILNDTWGEAIHHPYHTLLEIPIGYENLYTFKKHPSILGHQKLANWFIKELEF